MENISKKYEILYIENNSIGYLLESDGPYILA